MGSGGHRAADLLEMEVHGFAIGVGHHQGSADGTLPRTFRIVSTPCMIGESYASLGIG